MTALPPEDDEEREPADDDGGPGGRTAEPLGDDPVAGGDVLDPGLLPTPD